MNRFTTLTRAALLTVLAAAARARRQADQGGDRPARQGRRRPRATPAGSDRRDGVLRPPGRLFSIRRIDFLRDARRREIPSSSTPDSRVKSSSRPALSAATRNSARPCLRANGVKDLPTLTLGGADKLTELEELVTLGFPYGVRLDKDKPEYPSAAVDVCTVTAVNRNDGEPTVIVMKGGANAVLPGGPALDENAAAVGLITASSKEGGRAVPANRLMRFLAAPDFRLIAPALTPRTCTPRPSSGLASSPCSRLPNRGPSNWCCEPITGRSPGKDGFEGRRISGIGAPLSADDAHRLELSAQFETGSVSGFVEDREVQVGARKVKLSASGVSSRNRGRRPFWPTAHPLEGVVTGLGKVDFIIGGQTVPLDLGRAASIQVLPPRPVAAVECTLIAGGRRGGRPLPNAAPRQGRRAGGTRRPGRDGDPPAPLDAETVVKTLPDIASDVQVGGGGRYLIFQLPKLKKLAVFDVNAAAIVRYLPLTEDKIAFAAGLEKVVVGLTASGVLERWDLATGEKELTRTLPNAADVNSVLMGSASRGPVVVNGTFHDLYSLKPLPIKTPFGVPPPWSPVSADGTVFGSWKNNQSPTESTSFVLQGDELKRYDEGGTGYVVPGPDGRVVYTAAGLRTNQLKGLDGAPKVGLCLPATEGAFFLALTSAEGGKGGRIGVYMQGNDQPLVKDVGFELGVHYDRGTFGPWKRVFFIPRAKLIVVFPESNDRLEFADFDVEEALEKSGLDYLLVTSRPPATAKRRRIHLSDGGEVEERRREGSGRYRPGGTGGVADGAGEMARAGRLPGRRRRGAPHRPRRLGAGGVSYVHDPDDGRLAYPPSCASPTPPPASPAATDLSTLVLNSVADVRIWRYFRVCCPHSCNSTTGRASIQRAENAEKNNGEGSGDFVRRAGREASDGVTKGDAKDTTSTFAANRGLAVHRWFRYSAGFSAAWVREVIEREKEKGRRRVFDPFVGSGTVALESERCQVEGIGVEAHPFVARIAQTKLHWRESPQVFTTYALSILEEAKRVKVEREAYPALMGKCFPPETLGRLEARARSPKEGPTVRPSLNCRGWPCAPSFENAPLSARRNGSTSFRANRRPGRRTRSRLSRRRFAYSLPTWLSGSVSRRGQGLRCLLTTRGNAGRSRPPGRTSSLLHLPMRTITITPMPHGWK